MISLESRPSTAALRNWLRFIANQQPIWSGRIGMQAEEYKFAANRSWIVNWGRGGQPNGPNFPALSQSGQYDVTFNENDPGAATVVLAVPNPNQATKFICENGQTTFGTSVYVVGNVPELGQWNPNDAVLLKPDGPYPTWTGIVPSLPAEGQIEWKCIKRQESGDRRVVEWEADPNNSLNRSKFEQVGRF